MIKDNTSLRYVQSYNNSYFHHPRKQTKEKERKQIGYVYVPYHRENYVANPM